MEAESDLQKCTGDERSWRGPCRPTGPSHQLPRCSQLRGAPVLLSHGLEEQLRMLIRREPVDGVPAPSWCGQILTAHAEQSITVIFLENSIVSRSTKPGRLVY